MRRIAVALLLERPQIHKALPGSLGVATPAPGAVRQQSRAPWSLALGAFAGIDPADQLAFAFRGCASFWVAGEIADLELDAAFRAAAGALLLGFVAPGGRAGLLRRIEGPHDGE